MIFEDNKCPECGRVCSHYDTVQRLVRLKGGKKSYVRLERVICRYCGGIHRVLDNDILPYKHYEAEIIKGVVEGLITSDTLGFEDYPCERTMDIWRSTDFLFT